MADTALARLRGILAATMTRTAMDVLIAEVRAEWDEQQVPLEQPIPYELTEPSPVVRAADQAPPMRAGQRATIGHLNWPKPPFDVAPLVPRHWADTSTYAHEARLCLHCGHEARAVGPTAAEVVDVLMNQHLASHPAVADAC